MPLLNELAASSARTATGNGTAVEVGDVANTLVVQCAVTAHSGTTPTLDVVVQDTLDGTNWRTIATFAQVTTTDGVAHQTVTAPFTNKIRARWVIGGTTPSYTFSVIAYAE